MTFCEAIEVMKRERRTIARAAWRLGRSTYTAYVHFDTVHKVMRMVCPVTNRTRGRVWPSAGDQRAFQEDWQAKDWEIVD